MAGFVTTAVLKLIIELRVKSEDWLFLMAKEMRAVPPSHDPDHHKSP